MRRGADGAVDAAGAAIERGAGVHELLMAAAEQWSDWAGGSSGALWSAALMAVAAALGNRDSYGATDLVSSAVAGRDAMAVLGDARPGDKTVLDAVYPFVAALQTEVDEGRPVAQALQAAAGVATRAAADTAPLRPRKGRARPLAEPERRHPGPRRRLFCADRHGAGRQSRRLGEGPSGPAAVPGDS